MTKRLWQNTNSECPYWLPFSTPLKWLEIIMKWGHNLDTFIIYHHWSPREFLPGNQMVDFCWTKAWPGHYYVTKNIRFLAFLCHKVRHNGVLKNYTFPRKRWTKYILLRLPLICRKRVLILATKRNERATSRKSWLPSTILEVKGELLQI